jgi:CubicO group peptidase (beta-lactamase class C family)
MITRRGLLHAAGLQGLAASFGTAMAQQPRSKKKSDRSKRPPTDEPPVRESQRVSRVLAPIRDEHHLPGLIGAIFEGSRLTAIGAVGIRKIGSPDPFAVTDQVHIGSCTKAMTATVIGMLVDEGRLSWGSTIREVFPSNLDGVDPEYQKVTLGQLLTHRAGLPANVNWFRLHGRTPTEQRLSIVMSELRQPPRNRPGSKYEYSNVGYALAGLMAETAAGQSWETLMKARLFEPLQMSSAGFGSPGRPGTIEQPWGHRSLGGETRPTQQDNAPSMGPAGAVHCTIPDWAKFAALHLAAERGRPRLLEAATFRALHTPPAGFEYAGGWVATQRTWAGGLALTHSGSNTAWYATIWVAPGINRTIFAATNQGGKVAETAANAAIVALIRAGGFLSS